MKIHFKNKTINNSLILSIGLLVGRGLGYLRELLISYKFGATETSDLIILALTLPELISNLLAAGAATNIIVPRLNELSAEKVVGFLSEAWRKILIIIVIGYILFNIFSYFYFPYSTFIFLNLASFSIFPNAMAAITYAYLSYKQRFYTQASSNIVFNLVATLGLFLFDAIWLIVIGFVMASIMRFLVAWMETRKDSLESSFWFFWKPQKVYNLLSKRVFLYSVSGAGLVLINPMVDRLMAAHLQPGSISILSYAEKLYLLPVTILISPYIVASYPVLTQHIQNRENLNLAFLWDKLKLILAGSLAIGVVCWFLADHIVHLSFGLTGLGRLAEVNITRSFQAFIPALIFTSCSQVLNNIQFAQKSEKLVFIISFFSVSLNLVGDAVVVFLGMEMWMLAAVTSAVSVIVFILQLAIILRSNQKRDIEWN